MSTWLVHLTRDSLICMSCRAWVNVWLFPISGKTKDDCDSYHPYSLLSGIKRHSDIDTDVDGRILPPNVANVL